MDNKVWNGRLPENQRAMLRRVEEVHGYGTRSARAGLHLATRDHGSVGYRVPEEWGTLGEVHRGMGSLAGFKRESKRGFLGGYGAFRCVGCYVCAGQGGVGQGAGPIAREPEVEGVLQ